MTVQEIIDEAWNALGRPTDLDPATDPTAMTRAANEGQKAIACWKDPQTGKPVRMHDLISSMNFRTTYLETTVASISNSTKPYYMTLTDTVQTNDDEYNDWIIEMTDGDADGEIRYISDYTGATRTVYYVDDYGTAPSVGDSVKLYKNFSMLLPASHAWASEHIILPSTTDQSRNTGNLVEVLSIVDIENQRELSYAKSKEKYPSKLTQVGDPTEWFRLGNKIIFDTAVDDYMDFKLEYYRLPLDMVYADNDEPDIPSQFHWAIVMWIMWWGYKRKMEQSSAYATKRDLEDFMRRTIQETDVMKERIELKGSIKYD